MSECTKSNFNPFFDTIVAVKLVFLQFIRDDLLKKNGKKDDIVQKGGRGLGQNHHF